MSILSLDTLLLSPMMFVDTEITDSMRDMYGAEFHQTTEHFALHYGSEMVISEEQVFEILDIFEETWQLQIEEMGYPIPQDTTVAKFNVYLGDSQLGLPPSYGVSGYYSLDQEGWPMIVLGEYVLQNWEETQSTIPHEFFHAIQHSLGVYRNDSRSKWYWEATATWMETQHFPSDPMTGIFLFGFLFHPHLPINYYEPVQDGNSEEFYTYGAFLFPYYISEEWADPNWIRDSWLNVSPTQTPLDYLTSRIDEEQDFADVLLDFTLRCITYDIGDAYLYEDDVESYGDMFRNEDHRITVTLPPSGNSNFTKTSLPLFRTGFHHINLQNLNLYEPVLEMEFDLVGSMGSVAEWRVGLLDEDGSWIALDITDNYLQWTGDLTTKTSLVVTVWTSLEKTDEIFTYQYRVHEYETTNIHETDGGCRGNSGSSKSTTMFGFLFLLLCWIRRQRG